MLTFPADWLSNQVVIAMLVSVRLFGSFLSMPLFALRSIPLRIRLGLALVLAWALLPTLSQNNNIQFSLSQLTWLSVAQELLFGVAAGWLVRVGLTAFDFLAEVLSMQAGLSFAASFNQDSALASGLTGELLGLLAIALAFALNIHLVFLDFLLSSFKVIPFGTWPSNLNWPSILPLIVQAFSLGAVFAMPAFAVYFLFNTTQGILARVSPQMNLFSVGFAIMVPLAFVVIALLLPAMGEAITRALEMPFELMRGWARPI